MMGVSEYAMRRLLHGLRHSTSLRTLVCPVVHFGDLSSLELLLDSPLSHLVVSGSRLSLPLLRPFLLRLPSAPHLQSLDLSCSLIDAPCCRALCAAIARNSSLRTLNLSLNRLEHSGPHLAMMLSRNASLRQLNLTHSGLLSDDLLALCEGLGLNSTLKKLAIGGNPPARGEQQMAEVLRHLLAHPALDCLDLTGLDLGAAHEEALLALVRGERLRWLQLAHNAVGDGLVEGLAAGRRQLEMLDLSYNRLSEGAVAGLGRLLGGDATLQCLNLSGVHVSQAALGSIAAGLECNETLVALFLNACGIDAEGAGVLVGALRRNETLAELILSRNEITPEGLTAICEMLATNTALRFLHLGQNPIGVLGPERLASALHGNGYLEAITLPTELLTERTKDEISALVDRNQANNTMRLATLYQKLLNYCNIVSFLS